MLISLFGGIRQSISIPGVVKPGSAVAVYDIWYDESGLMNALASNNKYDISASTDIWYDESVAISSTVVKPGFDVDSLTDIWYDESVFMNSTASSNFAVSTAVDLLI